jgi:hypothetical protein
MIFVILTFSKHHIESILRFLENKIPFLKDSLLKNLEKQKQLLWHNQGQDIEESVLY